MTTRRETLTLSIAGALMLGTSRLVWAASPVSLDFDPDAFTTLTTTITTASGDHQVTYRFYKAIPYVANPVDVAYQCLNISVPVEIDGVAVDASGAPILFCNSVGGYMPASVAQSDGVDSAPMPAGMMPPKTDGEVPSGGNAMMARGERVSIAKHALAAGFVAVEPGARGRSLTDAAGVYYGVAPAAIVDLKAAVRYLRLNAGKVPGNTDWIISTGTSAGGALSSLLGATGDSADYAPYLEALGAAGVSDAVFAAGCWCPITDLEHADMAYEWNWGSNPVAEGSVDAALSGALGAAFPAYQDGLGLQGVDGFGPLTADRLGDYLTRTYLIPAATAFLTALSGDDRAAYLAANPGITWDGSMAAFGWADFTAHVGARKKAAPAFDALDLTSGENNLFGLGTTEARHFTTWSLRQATGDATAELDADLPATVALMNPMPFIAARNPGRARHWWLRVGAKDSDTSLSVVGNLAAALQGAGDEVNTLMYWDQGHGSNLDADAFMVWIGQITGYAKG